MYPSYIVGKQECATERRFAIQYGQLVQRKAAMASQSVQSIDHLDARILQTLHAEPRIGMLELARRLGVARGTAQARMDKMADRGVITGFGPDISLDALGFGVTAFTTIEVLQGRSAELIEPLRDVPEVIEVHSIAGDGDLLLRIAARSNKHLMDVLEQILASDHIARSSTAIVLSTQIPARHMPLVEAATEH